MKQTTPAGMKASGRKLWAGITGKYELRIDELRLLQDACFEADLIESLVQGLKDHPDMFTRGSMGQQVINPIYGELRQHRTTLAALLKALKLPEEDGGQAAANRSENARSAANARWATAHGA